MSHLPQSKQVMRMVGPANHHHHVQNHRLSSKFLLTSHMYAMTAPLVSPPL